MGVAFQPALEAHVLWWIFVSHAGAESRQGGEPCSGPSIHSSHFMSQTGSWTDNSTSPTVCGLGELLSCDLQTTDGP